MPPDECCKTCRFLRGWDEDVPGGDCRRYPPVFVPFEQRRDSDGRLIENDGGWKFPPMTDEDWCGEYRPGEVSA